MPGPRDSSGADGTGSTGVAYSRVASHEEIKRLVSDMRACTYVPYGETRLNNQIRKLIADRVNLSLSRQFENNLLLEAIHRLQQDLVAILLKSGQFDINHAGKNKLTALNALVQNESTISVNNPRSKIFEMINKGAKLDTVDIDGNNIFHHANPFYAKMILARDNLDEASIKGLLVQPNHWGKRPIDDLIEESKSDRKLRTLLERFVDLDSIEPNPAEIDISQSRLLAKLKHYLVQHNRSLELFPDSGSCKGLVYLHNYYGIQGRLDEFYSILESITSWDGKDAERVQLCPALSSTFKNLADLIEYTLNLMVVFQYSEVSKELGLNKRRSGNQDQRRLQHLLVSSDESLMHFKGVSNQAIESRPSEHPIADKNDTRQAHTESNQTNVLPFEPSSPDLDDEPDELYPQDLELMDAISVSNQSSLAPKSSETPNPPSLFGYHNDDEMNRDKLIEVLHYILKLPPGVEIEFSTSGSLGGHATGAFLDAEGYLNFYDPNDRMKSKRLASPEVIADYLINRAVINLGYIQYSKQNDYYFYFNMKLLHRGQPELVDKLETISIPELDECQTPKAFNAFQLRSPSSFTPLQIAGLLGNKTLVEQYLKNESLSKGMMHYLSSKRGNVSRSFFRNLTLLADQIEDDWLIQRIMAQGGEKTIRIILEWLIFTGQYGYADKIIRQYSLDLNAAYAKTSLLALVITSEKIFHASINFLLARGADVNCQPESTRSPTPLFQAIARFIESNESRPFDHMVALKEQGKIIFDLSKTFGAEDRTILDLIISKVEDATASQSKTDEALKNLVKCLTLIIDDIPSDTGLQPDNIASFTRCMSMLHIRGEGELAHKMYAKLDASLKSNPDPIKRVSLAKISIDTIKMMVDSSEFESLRNSARTHLDMVRSEQSHAGAVIDKVLEGILLADHLSGQNKENIIKTISGFKVIDNKLSSEDYAHLDPKPMGEFLRILLASGESELAQSIIDKIPVRTLKLIHKTTVSSENKTKPASIFELFVRRPTANDSLGAFIDHYGSTSLKDTLDVKFQAVTGVKRPHEEAPDNLSSTTKKK